MKYVIDSSVAFKWVVPKAGCGSEKVMLDEAILEQRLATLEQAVADLQQCVAQASGSGDLLQRITGSISDKPAFLKALEFGRAFRHADRPVDDQSADRAGE